MREDEKLPPPSSPELLTTASDFQAVQQEEEDHIRIVALLVERGVIGSVVSELVAVRSAETIVQTVGWYDERRANGDDIGPGVLVQTLRQGGTPGFTPRASQETGPCVWTPELQVEWDRMVDQAESGEEELRLVLPWLAAIHPHAASAEGWTLAADRWALAYWTPRGRLVLLERMLRAPVQIVACERTP